METLDRAIQSHSDHLIDIVLKWQSVATRKGLVLILRNGIGKVLGGTSATSEQDELEPVNILSAEK